MAAADKVADARPKTRLQRVYSPRPPSRRIDIIRNVLKRNWRKRSGKTLRVSNAGAFRMIMTIL
ncbi:hypothetical protein JQ615_01320 [Bradyrhizobium jicamae]|uniref:Transposase n=1 Tax=Bradyrhizobium jicamae TaxID=280332 RepID=A0ABS5FB66_9BRAD|nr:hypothetical protein [Bradyrhizobium jicamae]